MSAALERLHDRIEAVRSRMDACNDPLVLTPDSCGALELHVEGDDPRWIASYLEPYYVCSRSSDHTERTRVYVAAADLEGFSSSADELANATVATGIAGRRVVRLSWKGNDSFLQLKRASPEMLVVFQQDAVITFVPPSALAQHQQSAIRILRCLTIMHAMNSGHILLHGAGVVDGGAVLLVGRKRAGKSTTALSALSAGFAFLTNDQALYTPSSGRVSGLPIAVGVRPPSLSLFPVLEARAVAGSLSHYYQTATGYGGTPIASAEPSDDERVTFLPSELCEAFGTDICPTAPLKAVFVLGFEPGRTRIESERLSRAKATDALEQNTFRTVCEKQPLWDVRLTRVQPNADAIGVLADSVPCIRVRFGERHGDTLLEQMRRHATGASL